MFFIVVDYCSTEEFRDELRSAFEQADIKVIRTETAGYPWSRAIAMNIGIFAVETDVFISTDIDMIFESDVISAVMTKGDKGKKIHCRPYWLPQSGDKVKDCLGDFNQLWGYVSHVC